MKILFCFFCMCFTIAANAQNSSPNDCINAIQICGNGAISTNANGTGYQEINMNNSCSSQEHNSIWLKINITKTGTLGFTLKPISSDLSIDYDFFIFGPNATCDNLGNSIRCSTTNPLAAGLVSNYTGLNDAELDEYEGPGENGNSFLKSLDVKVGETYYIVIDRPIGNSPFELEWTGTATQGGDPFPPAPTIQKPKDLIECGNNGEATFDLFSTKQEINSNSNYNIAYFKTLADANDYSNELPQYYTSTISEQTIYARLDNPLTGCFSITNFKLLKNDSPKVSNSLSYSLCDDNNDGSVTFKLTNFNNDVLASSSNSNMVSYYKTKTDAKTFSNAITSITIHTNTTIYANVQDAANIGCYTTLPISLIKNNLPIAKNYTLTQCDVDVTNSTDGITSFNLEEAIPFLANITDDIDITLYRESKEITQLLGYENTTPFQENIDVVVTNKTTGCQNFSTLTLKVNPTFASLPESGPVYACNNDKNDNTLEGYFDLEAIKNEYYKNLDVQLYPNIQDASLEINAISGNQYLSTSTIIYARIENNNQCQGIQQIQLIVKQKPKITINNEYLMCLNQTPLTIISPDICDVYYWYKRTENSFEIVSNTKSVNISEPGNYVLVEGYKYNNLICDATKEFTVIASNIARINPEPDIKDISDNNIVTVFTEGEGNYEYALNNVNGPYQDSNIFENVSSGFSTVYVRDKNGCGIISKEIAVIGYDKYFTPNGDGVNDFWNIKGISNFIQPNSFIFVFDRYGKVVKQLHAGDKGWDGTSQGIMVPSSDYWFRVLLQDGRTFKGHFTLKR
ncbi:T9SS type B sorting domain-containing protein [Zhouia sp. PK063]|uniref:T9SS type B sorting domain-containing protein n=1 Tax=Zhouia sp. PK063 TaxID=3373602 RepID=UPI00378E944E